MDPCPFCDTGIAEYAYFKHRGFLAIINIAPVLPGHSLVIPEMHRTSLTSLDEEELCAFMEAARKATRILIKAFDTDAFDWSVQEKPEAGQSIEHLHLHIVPRIKDDLPRPGDWYPLVHENDEAIIDSADRKRLNSAEKEIIVEKLRKVADELK
jgi:bis(5'-adenosyl)-triphosphatase